MRKPLNAFLGEWTDETSTVRMISEQVSHQPPITASYMWDDEHGIRGMGYTRVEMSFSRSLNVKQTSHAMLHLDKYNEDYLIPFPDCKVKGFLSGSLYPELGGTCQIILFTGFVLEISFSGQGFFSGIRNSFKATMYQAIDNLNPTIFSASGQWSGEFMIRNLNDENDIETCVAASPPAAPLQISDIAVQDPWEIRNAWKDVLAALVKGDMQKIIYQGENKTGEEAQRAMSRKRQLRV